MHTNKNWAIIQKILLWKTKDCSIIITTKKKKQQQKKTCLYMHDISSNFHEELILHQQFLSNSKD